MLGDILDQDHVTGEIRSYKAGVTLHLDESINV